MAAKDALRSEQLAMFVPAKDLISARPLPGDRRYTEDSYFTKKETNNDLWDRKLGESKEQPTDVHGGTLHKEIAKEGVKTPIRVMWESGRSNPTIANGHHRIVSANDIDPEMLVPVMHYTDDEHLANVVNGEDHYTLADIPRPKPSRPAKKAARRKD